MLQRRLLEIYRLAVTEVYHMVRLSGYGRFALAKPLGAPRQLVF
jgi:hypothetical protein